MTSIGFIGLGNMGAPMAGNLVAAGLDVTGHDVAERARTTARAKGLDIADSATEAAADRDIVITMLPDGAVLLEVYRTIVAEVRAGTILMDCSTVDIDSARQAHDLAAERNLPSVDAPVSGGIAGAEAGTLTFMAGGDPPACEAVRPLLDIMGRTIVRCGGPGCGQAVKICNNMILGISMIGVCEALTLARKLELEPERVFDVVSTSSGSCWSMNSYCPLPGVGPESPADHGYAPGFAAALMLKDLGLSQQAAASANVATPMGAMAASVYEAMVASGSGHLDFSAVIRHVRSLARE
ncbi:MAG: 3-hydroxyisobutyrate dehydrogenase [Alphaproteobacteria bacterium]|nr:3-hydroxyisobutyrate dehydrogenase [Alphaproteobacteria bacterium]